MHIILMKRLENIEPVLELYVSVTLLINCLIFSALFDLKLLI